MYYNTTGYSLNDLMGASSSSMGAWAIVSLVLAIVGAILGYFMFVKPEKHYPNKFVNWLRSFLNFNEMLIEPILKVTYMFLAILITLSSFELIGTSFVGFLLMLVLGNLLIRVIYEASMMMVGIWKNTKEINNKMKK